MKAIETTGIINARGQLVLDEPLLAVASTRARVVILLPEETDIDEMKWLRVAA